MAQINLQEFAHLLNNNNIVLYEFNVIKTVIVQAHCRLCTLLLTNNLVMIFNSSSSSLLQSRLNFTHPSFLTGVRLVKLESGSLLSNVNQFMWIPNLVLYTQHI